MLCSDIACLAVSRDTHLELINSDGAAVVGVDGLEELAQPADLFRGQTAGHHQEGCLLQFGHASKLQPD